MHSLGSLILLRVDKHTASYGLSSLRTSSIDGKSIDYLKSQTERDIDSSYIRTFTVV